MIYRITIDGLTIYDSISAYSCLNPRLSMELNSAGTLSFTMTRNHKYFDSPAIKLLTSDVFVYEENNIIWNGRITKITSDWYNKTIECEGSLAFFNDSVQRPYEYSDFTVKEFFTYLIEQHNAQVPSNRAFSIGVVEIPENTLYRKLEYETTFEALSKMCINAEGGYFLTRYEKGTNYIDWYKNAPYVSNQPIRLGSNLLDFNKDVDGTKIITSIIPLGKDDDGNEVTCVDANNGLDYIDKKELVDQYGRITQVVNFDDTKTADGLVAKVEDWFEDNKIEPISIEVEAAELAYIDKSYSAFKIGYRVHVVSDVHKVNDWYPILKINISMDDASKKINIGTVKKQDLTEIYKDEDSSSGYSSGGSSGGGGGGGGGGDDPSTEVNDSKITVRMNSRVVTEFTLNQKDDETINLYSPEQETTPIDFTEEW